MRLGIAHDSSRSIGAALHALAGIPALAEESGIIRVRDASQKKGRGR